MLQSEAFKAARARWSSLPVQEAQAAATEVKMAQIQEQVQTDQNALHSVVNPGPSGTQHTHIEPSVVGPTVANAKDKARDEILLRIAIALENIAQKMSGPSTLATNNEVQKSVCTAAQIVPASNKGKEGATSAAKVTNPFSAPESMPSTSADYDFGFMMVDDSDEEVEPAKRCGVCRGPCEKTFALSCGHYPYCGACVNALTEKEVSSSYLFKCPFCTKIVTDKLELHIDEE